MPDTEVTWSNYEHWCNRGSNITYVLRVSMYGKDGDPSNLYKKTTMKTVILAGGYGTRFSEETITTPKPMVEIGGKPILWHIMKIYATHGITDFIICLGYKGYVIKEYFANYFLHTSDVTFYMKMNMME